LAALQTVRIHDTIHPLRFLLTRGYCCDRKHTRRRPYDTQ